MLRSPFSHLRQLPQFANNSIMVVEGKSAETAQTLQFVEMLVNLYPRIGITLVSRSGDAAPDDTENPPGQLVKVSRPTSASIRALLDATNPGLVLFSGMPAKQTLALRRTALRRGCAMALVTTEPINSAERRDICSRYALDHIFDISCGHMETLNDQDIKTLRDLTRRQVRNVAFSRRKSGVMDWIAKPIDRHRFPDIDSIEHLSTLLGRPKTLMCLGNGPSGEAPELNHMHFDALFRVNSRWAARGYFIEPDLVFTNQQMAVRRLRPRVGFVVRSELDQRYLRWKLRWRAGHRRIGAATRLQLPCPIDCEDVVPSTGLLMLSMAVALQPDRLIVAGIDLFSDTSGAYPGDNQTLNDYSLDHDRNTERRFLIALLKQYRGELLIVGDVLRGAIAGISDSSRS